jgi:hypothetical protein
MKPVFAFLILLLPLIVVPAAAQQATPAPNVPILQTAAGAAPATVTGQVAAGARNAYYVSAQSLQALAVTITSTGNNAVFQVYDPSATVSGDGTNVVITGSTLADAGSKDAATAWMGMIPQSGKYLIAVGSKDGPASYTLTVQLQ